MIFSTLENIHFSNSLNGFRFTKSSNFATSVYTEQKTPSLNCDCRRQKMMNGGDETSVTPIT